MRPKLPDKEKRKIVVRLLLSEEEKIRLSYFVRNGKFGCMSDFLRYKIFDQSRKKIITLDEKDFPLIKRMDYELNKIGVNLIRLQKKSIPTTFTSLRLQTGRFSKLLHRKSKIAFLFCKNIST